MKWKQRQSWCTCTMVSNRPFVTHRGGHIHLQSFWLIKPIVIHPLKASLLIVKILFYWCDFYTVIYENGQRYNHSSGFNDFGVVLYIIECHTASEIHHNPVYLRFSVGWIKCFCYLLAIMALAASVWYHILVEAQHLVQGWCKNYWYNKLKKENWVHICIILQFNTDTHWALSC